MMEFAPLALLLFRDQICDLLPQRGPEGAEANKNYNHCMVSAHALVQSQMQLAFILHRTRFTAESAFDLTVLLLHPSSQFRCLTQSLG